MAGIITNEPGHDGETPIAGINVTSLIDVVMCLLIAFMATSSKLSPIEGVEVELPSALGMEISESQFLYKVISVDAAGQVYLGVVPLATDNATMVEQLANNAKIKEDQMVFLQGDASVPFERIIDIVVALKQAGVTQIGFVTQPSVQPRKKGEVSG